MNRIAKLSIFSVGLAMIIFIASYFISYKLYSDQIHGASLAELNLYSKTFKSKLFELRSLNKVLSYHPVIINAFADVENKTKIKNVNDTLIKSRNLSGAAQIYLLDKSGLTIASSNWYTKESFVGNNYRFRPYFKEAMAGLSGQFYAIGINSNRRGYYFSEPVYKNRQIIGIVALKVDIDRLEEIIKTQDEKLLILDNFGIVFLSNEKKHLYQQTKIINDKDWDFLTATKRYNNRQVGSLIIKKVEKIATKHLIKIDDEGVAENYIRAELEFPIIGWKIVNLVKESKVKIPAYISAIISTFIIMALGFLIQAIRARQKYNAERIAFKNQQAIELERRVQERSSELKQVQDDLVQTAKLAALGQMSAAISHELSQPLTAMTNYTENSKLYLQKNQFDKVAQNIQYIEKLTNKMTAIIHHIKIFASKRPTEIEKISINKVIAETVWFMQSKFQRREVELELKIPKQDVYINANSVRIEQVLMNLISNALESMQKTDIKKLSISMSTSDDLVNIVIRDTGEGIKEDKIEKIFKPFYTTKYDENGMGIGLSISRSIVEEYDGILEAFNRATGGARFEIKLPIQQI